MLEFQDVVLIAQMLVIVVLAFRLRGAIPMEETRALLTQLQDAAEKTHTRIDDTLVDLAFAIFGIVEQDAIPDEGEDPKPEG